MLCVCGMSGSGKSTVARRLAERYKLRYLSGGDTLRSLAVEKGYRIVGGGWWESEEGRRFLEQRMSDFSFDRAVDEKLLRWARKGGVVLDSWTMPWLFKSGFKVWLECSVEVRARRLMRRNNVTFEETLEALRVKEENTKAIYLDLYGFRLGEDFGPFDLILDTNFLGADDVFHVLCSAIDECVLRRKR